MHDVENLFQLVVQALTCDQVELTEIILLAALIKKLHLEHNQKPLSGGVPLVCICIIAHLTLFVKHFFGNFLIYFYTFVLHFYLFTVPGVSKFGVRPAAHDNKIRDRTF